MMTNEQSVFSSLFFSLQPSFHTICYAITIPQSINFFNIFLCFRIFYSFSMISFHLFLTYLSRLFRQTLNQPLTPYFYVFAHFLVINHTTNISLFFITSLPSPMMPAMLSFPDLLFRHSLHRDCRTRSSASRDFSPRRKDGRHD